MTLVISTPADLVTEVVRNAYGNLARVEQLAVEESKHTLVQRPGSLPAIFVRPTRHEPLLSGSRRWAWVNVRVYTWHPDAHLELDPADLRVDSRRVHPGYLPEQWAHLPLNLKADEAWEPVKRHRENGLYLAAHRWCASLLIA